MVLNVPIYVKSRDGIYILLYVILEWWDSLRAASADKA